MSVQAQMIVQWMQIAPIRMDPILARVNLAILGMVILVMVSVWLFYGVFISWSCLKIYFCDFKTNIAMQKVLIFFLSLHSSDSAQSGLCFCSLGDKVSCTIWSLLQKGGCNLKFHHHLYRKCHLTVIKIPTIQPSYHQTFILTLCGQTDRKSPFYSFFPFYLLTAFVYTKIDYHDVNLTQNQNIYELERLNQVSLFQVVSESKAVITPLIKNASSLMVHFTENQISKRLHWLHIFENTTESDQIQFGVQEIRFTSKVICTVIDFDRVRSINVSTI